MQWFVLTDTSSGIETGFVSWGMAKPLNERQRVFTPPRFSLPVGRLSSPELNLCTETAGPNFQWHTLHAIPTRSPGVRNRPVCTCEKISISGGRDAQSRALAQLRTSANFHHTDNRICSQSVSISGHLSPIQAAGKDTTFCRQHTHGVSTLTAKHVDNAYRFTT